MNHLLNFEIHGVLWHPKDIISSHWFIKDSYLKKSIIRTQNLLENTAKLQSSTWQLLYFFPEYLDFNQNQPWQVLPNQEYSLLKLPAIFYHCRSTLARYAASPYQYERHRNAPNKLKHNYFQSNSKLLLSYVFKTIVHIYRYVSSTYPQQMYLYIGTYLYGTSLIPTRSEPLRNKRVFTEFYQVIST